MPGGTAEDAMKGLVIWTAACFLLQKRMSWSREPWMATLAGTGAWLQWALIGADTQVMWTVTHLVLMLVSLWTWREPDYFLWLVVGLGLILLDVLYATAGIAPWQAVVYGFSVALFYAVARRFAHSDGVRFKKASLRDQVTLRQRRLGNWWNLRM